MTSKKGSLWKTSWNRGRGTPLPDPVGQMAFFQAFRGPDALDNAFYGTAPTVSSLGTELPFWYASVGIRTSGNLQSVNAPSAFETKPSSDVGYVAATGDVSGVGTNLLLGVPGDDFVSATLITVIKTGATSFRARQFLDDQVYQVIDGDPFTPATLGLSFAPNRSPGGLHGFAGGQGFTPTDAEIHEWFRALKANLQIKEIIGKTTHRYSAADAYPLVPATLTNLGTAGAAQNLAYTVVGGAPVPANNLISVRFPY